MPSHTTDDCKLVPPCSDITSISSERGYERCDRCHHSVQGIRSVGKHNPVTILYCLCFWRPRWKCSVASRRWQRLEFGRAQHRSASPTAWAKSWNSRKCCIILDVCLIAGYAASEGSPVISQAGPMMCHTLLAMVPSNWICLFT